MAEWEVIQERKISGKGVLKVPPDKNKVRAYVLFGTVVREPVNKYTNFNWNPPRSRYASIALLRQGYIIDTLSMEFNAQVWDGVNDVSGQTLIAVKCAYAGMLESFAALSRLVILSNPLLSLATDVVSITDLIKDYENLRLSWDEARINCYADTAISFRLSALKYDVCDPEKDKDKPPPPPPPPIPPVPPGQPIFDISPPYEEETSDNNNTAPYPEDVPPPPELPPPGLNLIVTIVWEETTGQNAGVRRTNDVEVTSPYYVSINLTSYLGVFTPWGWQPGFREVLIISYGNPTPDIRLKIISITDNSGYAVDVRYAE